MPVTPAGQVSDASLERPLIDAGQQVFKIGGAFVASELDAKRAIDQACRLAAEIETASPESVGKLVAPVGLASQLFSKVKSMSAK